MIGESFRDSIRRVESRDCRNRNSCWCVTDINRSGYPFLVWSGGNGWQRDTFLRFECLDTEIPCCERIALVASPKGLANTWQPARLGVYQATNLRNGRYFYTHEKGGSFIYYWDWGPNSGCNWVVTNDADDGNNRGIESANVEYGKTLLVNNTVCFNEARKAGEFSVWNGEAQNWQIDRSVRVLCDPET